MIITKVALLKAPYDIDIVERELVCGDEEVIVKNHLIGICGSDKNFYRGLMVGGKYRILYLKDGLLTEKWVNQMDYIK